MGILQQGDRAKEEGNEGARPIFSSKLAKLEFPKYSGEDPTEWFTRVEQFFEYQSRQKRFH